jgi:hypothetical protein
MNSKLPAAVRDTYSRVAQSQRSTSAAFEKALELVMQHLPSLTEAEARKEVARMLATEPTSPRAACASPNRVNKG